MHLHTPEVVQTSDNKKLFLVDISISDIVTLSVYIILFVWVSNVNVMFILTLFISEFFSTTFIIEKYVNERNYLNCFYAVLGAI